MGGKYRYDGPDGRERRGDARWGNGHGARNGRRDDEPRPDDRRRREEDSRRWDQRGYGHGHGQGRREPEWQSREPPYGGYDDRRRDDYQHGHDRRRSRSPPSYSSRPQHHDDGARSRPRPGPHDADVAILPYDDEPEPPQHSSRPRDGDEHVRRGDEARSPAPKRPRMDSGSPPSPMRMSVSPEEGRSVGDVAILDPHHRKLAAQGVQVAPGAPARLPDRPGHKTLYLPERGSALDATRPVYPRVAAQAPPPALAGADLPQRPDFPPAPPRPDVALAPPFREAGTPDGLAPAPTMFEMQRAQAQALASRNGAPLPPQQPVPPPPGLAPPPPPPPAPVPPHSDPAHAPLHPALDPTVSSRPGSRSSTARTPFGPGSGPAAGTPALRSPRTLAGTAAAVPVEPAAPPRVRTRLGNARYDPWLRAPSPSLDELAAAARAVHPPVPLRDARSYVGCSDIGEYEKQGKLGEGTFGVVWKGVRGGRGKLWGDREREEEERLVRERGLRVRHGDVVALKQIIFHNEADGVRPSPSLLLVSTRLDEAVLTTDTFLLQMPITSIREIRLLKMLDHPNVVPVVDMAYEPGASSSFLLLLLLAPSQADSSSACSRPDDVHQAGDLHGLPLHGPRPRRPAREQLGPPRGVAHQAVRQAATRGDGLPASGASQSRSSSSRRPTH